jgi:hypothetical protein
MKILKGVIIFGFLNALLGCFDPPEYSIEPEIDFVKIEFAEVGSFSDADSLILTINFKDGDGDLGLRPSQIDFPFNTNNFFVGENQQKTAVSAGLYSDFSGLRYASNGTTPKSPTYVIDSAPSTGTFVSLDDQAEYGLPPYAPPYTCTAYYQSYLRDTIFVRAPDRFAIKPDDLVGTLVDSQGNQILFAALNTWYIELNSNHYNITVKFLVKQSDNSFREFDFREEYCSTYDGRFPELSDSKRALEGTLRYVMEGTGFLSTFSVNTLKLEIQIKDRALHTSNVIETPEFTLNGIRR